MELVSKVCLFFVFTNLTLLFRFLVQQNAITMTAFQFALCFYLTSTVYASPPKLLQLPSHFDLVENISFPLTCSLLSGDGQITFSWTYNGVQLENSSDYQLDSSSLKFSLLTIRSVQRHHAGTYECRAVNSFGETDLTRTRINVQGNISDSSQYVALGCSP